MTNTASPTDDDLKEYLLATTKFVKACGADASKWSHVELWAMENDGGVLGDGISISVNGTIIWGILRP